MGRKLTLYKIRNKENKNSTIQKKIQVLIEHTKTGYSCYTSMFPIATTGRTIAELKSNMLEAINLYMCQHGSIFIKQSHVIIDDLDFFVLQSPLRIRIFYYPMWCFYRCATKKVNQVTFEHFISVTFDGEKLGLILIWTNIIGGIALLIKTMLRLF